jgi:hypothetical protein
MPVREARTPTLRGWLVHKFWVYDDLIDNPKYMLLPDEAKVFLSLVWCVASKQTVRDGSLPPTAEIAFRARCTVAHAEAQLAALASAGWVEKSGGRFHVSRWLEFQGEAVTKAERQRRYRRNKLAAKAAQTSQNGECGATRGATDGTRGATRGATGDGKIEREIAPPTEALSSGCSNPQTNPPSSARPPTPQGGAARGWGEDDEPFDSGPDPEAASLPPDPPAVAEVTRLADELFPAGGMATAARAECLRGTRPEWVAEALRIARDAKASRWKFVASVLDRFARQGASDAERARASPGLTKTQRRRAEKIDEWAS